MALVYIEKVTTNRAAFEKKVIEIAGRLKMSPDWLMTVMYAESGLNHLAQNPSSSAFGLIQFLASTLASLGTTREKLRLLSNLGQLDYVEAYFKMIGVDQYRSIYDVYFAVFYPAAIGAPDEQVLFVSGGAAYVANKPLDLNSDWKITVGEIKGWFSRYIKAGTDIQAPPSILAGSNGLLNAGIGFLVMALLFRND